MSVLGDHNRWENSCRAYVNQGCTGQDIYYGGFYLFDSLPYPFPMGTVAGDGVRAKPWLERIEKAKRDIAEHESHCRFVEAMRDSQSVWEADDVGFIQSLSEGLFE